MIGSLRAIVLLGLVLAGSLCVNPARAQRWVSNASGVNDNFSCTRDSPCLTFNGALTNSTAGEEIGVINPGSYGPVRVTSSIAFVNDGAGMALVCCGAAGIPGEPIGLIVINAGPNDVVTLRGLTFEGTGAGGPVGGIVILSAKQVNIEKCTIRNTQLPAILVQPITPGNGPGGGLPSSITVNIQDTDVTGSAGGVRVTSVPNLPVNVLISRSKFQNNGGGGIRIDGTGGGTITASIADSESSGNSSNGIVAISGPGNVAVNVTHSVMASNVLSGVQSNATGGGSSAVTLRASTVTSNAGGQINFFGGGATLQTFGDNNIVGTNGTGFTGPVALQ